MRRLYYSIAYLVILGIPALILTYYIRDLISLRALAVTISIVLIVGGAFDIWAVRQNKKDAFFIWEYNSKSILGFKILGVPIEDLVFFLILTPIFIISIYESLVKTITIRGISSFPIMSLIVILILAYYIVYRHATKSKRS